jgi:hypothetical protein
MTYGDMLMRLRQIRTMISALALVLCNEVQTAMWLYLKVSLLNH